MQNFGKLDILVLAAGIAAHSVFGKIEDMKIARKIMEVNFMGTVLMTKHALRPLRESKGQIVVIGSLTGSMPLSQRSLYCASKSAVHSFFQSLQQEE